MISDNAKTTFKSLREKFRKEANLQLMLKKQEESPTSSLNIFPTGDLDKSNILNHKVDKHEAEEKELDQSQDGKFKLKNKSKSDLNLRETTKKKISEPTTSVILHKKDASTEKGTRL